MTNIYFTWFGGEGGDFLMGLLNYCLTGRQNFNINETGMCIGGEPEFTYDRHKFIKMHMVFTNKNFKNDQTKFVFWIKNPDKSIHLKKKILKLVDFTETFPPPPKPLIKRFRRALQNKDHKLIYYYLFSNFVNVYDRYKTSTEQALLDVQHKIINSNLIQEKDIIFALETISSSIKIPLELNNQVISIIQSYVEKQQQYIDLDWPHLHY